MVNKKIEKEHFLFLSQFDYIYVSSQIVKQFFEVSFKKYLIKQKNIKKAEVVNTGYLKLDHVSKLLKKYRKEKNKFCILIAPTALKHYSKDNLSSNLESMVNFLVKKKYEIIYRPHPMDLTKKGDINVVNKIKNKYQKFNNFKLDISSSYLESYSKSDVLITDFSGTAYTYAFSKNCPVIFFSKYANNKLKNDFKKLYYFRDRNKVGYIINNFSNLDKKLSIIKKNKNIFLDRIKKLKEKRIQYCGNSLEKTKKSIVKLLK